ncbi:MAG: monovalent cation/H+ antiporter subunit D family protein, partial [Desulfobacterales bacterium]|nr:monovalent cation/H+ antiporter subunit D family protein [Desulfobacterales bacterium]
MSTQLPAFIIIVPLLAAFATAAVGWINDRFCFPLTAAALTVSLFSCVALLARVLDENVIHYNLGGWPPPWGIAYRIDHLSGLILVVVSATALINLFAAHRSVQRQMAEKLGPFYTLYCLFVTGMLGIVATGDAFNLYVLLEITSLTGYALIGIGRSPAPLASLNSLFMGTVGASFYLLGIGYLYLMTGSLNMEDLARILPQMFQSKVVLFAFLICLAGLFIKMAFFPFHGWLPNAYSLAPSPVAGLLAPLTTKVMIYVMIRLTLYVFTPAFAFASLPINTVFVWLAVAAIVIASLLALSQRRLKRILAYIVIAEVGYMVGGLWLGNRDGITGAILHIVNDAAMTLCVFLAAGNLLFDGKEDSFEGLRGLFRTMPYSMAMFVVGALSLIGVPPTCGFFSKWYLLSGGMAAGRYGFVAALLFSSLVNLVLFFRIFEVGFFEPREGHQGHPPAALQEAPLSMLIPLLIV